MIRDVKVTPAAVLAEMAVLVKKVGQEYVYEKPENGCVYVDSGQPSCFIGRVLFALGADIDFLTDHEGQSAKSLAKALILKHGWEIDVEAMQLMTIAQSAQDGGATWSLARDIATSFNYTYQRP